MSIHNDYRKYGTDAEREEWKQELKSEYRKQDIDDQDYFIDPDFDDLDSMDEAELYD